MKRMLITLGALLLLPATAFGQAFTPEQTERMESVSKQFTGMAVLLLKADGRLSLDDDIPTYMPEVPNMGAVITFTSRYPPSGDTH